MRRIKLTKAYAGKEKGVELDMCSTRASRLVNVSKVAVYVDKAGETDKLLSEKRKKELKDKKISQLTAQLEVEHIKEVEAEFEEMLKSKEGEAFRLTLKKKILADLKEELKDK